MTADERNALRRLIDEKVRENTTPPPGCAGCGCDLDNRSAGCRTCMERHGKRRRMGTPARATWFTNPAERRRRRAAGRCAGCGCWYDHHTPGCRTCTYRQSKWRRSEAIHAVA